MMNLVWLFGMLVIFVCPVKTKRHKRDCHESPDDIRPRYSRVQREEVAFMSRWIRTVDRIDRDPLLTRDWKRRLQRVHTREYTFGPPSFNCDVAATKSPATSVHTLGPADINVVAALGDSITHGFGVGAHNFLEVMSGNRGESWSIGGDLTLEQGVITLPNILREFNPHLKGYSRCHSARMSSKAWLNVAEAGATNRQMPGQAQDIVDLCERDSAIDLDEDWKIVTLMVGGNDLCSSCISDEYNATMYAAHIEEALDVLQAKLPRTFVNLVPMFDITSLKNFSHGLICKYIQPTFCQCAVFEENRPHIRDTQLEYYQRLRSLVDSGKYDTKDDFTVVVQPMFVNLVPPIDPENGFYDKTFLSYDCFHPSRKAHQAFAYALWNTMFIPVAEKSLAWDPYEVNPTFTCPTEDNPYFKTRLNG